MKPPICELCGRDFRDDHPLSGGLVRFANYRPLPDGMVGHPEGLAWFCGEHQAKAEAFAHLSLPTALKKMSDWLRL